MRHPSRRRGGHLGGGRETGLSMSLSPTTAADAQPAAARGKLLGVLSVGHDNNLNLLRVLAASLVLVSHSYVLATGEPSAEPWTAHLGMSPGGLAVDIFFAVSGFLVTASLVGSASLWRFVSARALRIYPALWVALALTTLVVGVGFTDLSAADFFRDRQTWRYLGINAFMVTAEGPLPGAFAHVPFAGAVNGSLWTLRYELRMYALLALCWFISRCLRPRASVAEVRAGFAGVVIGVAFAFVVIGLAMPLRGRHSDFIALGAMFFQGAALFVLRGRVTIAWPLLAAMLAACGAAALVSPLAFGTVYRLCLPLAALHLAFLPGGPLRRYNRLGDYSYGIYIFAFPVQQMLMARFPSLDPLGLMAAAVVPTLVLAVLSWRVVEEKALAHKAAVAAWLARATSTRSTSS